MKNEIVSIGKHSLIYGLGMILSKTASFIMLPIYTQYLSPSDYGIAELLSTTVDIISMIVGVGIAATLFKFYSHYEDHAEKKEVISTALILLCVIAMVTSISGILLSSKISWVIFDRPDYALYFRLAFVVYFLQHGTAMIPLMFIRAQNNSILFVLIGVIKLVIQVSLNLYFLVFLNKGLVGIFYSSLLGEFIVGLYLFTYTFRSTGLRFSISKAKDMARFGYPFIFTSLGSFVLTYSDRYFINIFGDLETVGIYALAYKFGFLMACLAVDPLLQVWDPQRFEIAKRPEAPSIFRKVFLYFNIAMMTVSLVISLFVKDFLMIMAKPSYWEASRIVPIVILAYVFQGWTYYCNFGLYYGNKSNYLALSSILAVFVVTALNVALIPNYKAYGAAWATVGAFFLLFIFVHLFSKKYFSIDYGWGKQVRLLLVSICIYLSSFLLNIDNRIVSIGFNMILLLAFAMITYIFFLEADERSFIKRVLKSPIFIPASLTKLKI